MADKQKKRWGDRREGKYLRTLDPYQRIMPFIMRTRNDSNILFQDSVEISAAEKFLRQKRLDGFKGIGMLHVFVASYIRMLARYPGLNRFVSGQRVYARNEIEFIMTVKKEMTAAAPETSIKVTFSPADTLNDVYEKLNAAIAEVKNSGDTGTDKAAEMFMRLPRFILRWVVSILEFFDYHGWIPKALLDVSPFHGTLVITDLGSLGMKPVHHHLYNFGNVPVFIAMGAKRREYEPDADGAVTQRRYIDYTANCDERVCDGYYFAQCFKTLKNYLKNPQLLEEPPETVNTDPALDD